VPGNEWGPEGVRVNEIAGRPGQDNVDLAYRSRVAAKALSTAAKSAHRRRKPAASWPAERSPCAAASIFSGERLISTTLGTRFGEAAGHA